MPAIAAAPLDLTLRVDTPEGSALPLTPASPLQRSLAWRVDAGVRRLLSILILNLTSLLGDFGSGLWLLFLFLINWWYMVLFEVLTLGSTPGKRVMGLRVVQLDGSPPDWGSSLLRNLLRVIDMLPLGYSLGVAVALGNRRFQRLGDLVAGTLVVHEPRTSKMPPPEPLPAQSCLIPLTGEEQQALLAFDERQPQLTAARRDELASLLQPVLDLDGQHPAHSLGRIASGLRGQP